MNKIGRFAVLLVVFAAGAMGAFGCRSSARAAKDDHPKAEHPKGEQPKGDHPKH